MQLSCYEIFRFFANHLLFVQSTIFNAENNAQPIWVGLWLVLCLKHFQKKDLRDVLCLHCIVYTVVVIGRNSNLSFGLQKQFAEKAIYLLKL